MSAPKRIQRQRTKGWRMPEGAVYVGRPGQWGNPFRVGEPFRFTDNGKRPFVGVAHNHGMAVAAFKEFLKGRPDLMKTARESLGGKDLACWCRLDQPCHADVLLEVANGGGDS